MPDQSERPQLVTVPTELDRKDAFYDLAVLAASVLILWDAILNGVPWLWLVPGVLIVALWTLTGEPAADVAGVGWVAAGLRSKLGLRRAHEWLLALGHFYRVAIWPVWRAQLWRTYVTLRTATLQFLQRCSCVVGTGSWFRSNFGMRFGPSTDLAKRSTSNQAMRTWKFSARPWKR